MELLQHVWIPGLKNIFKLWSHALHIVSLLLYCCILRWALPSSGKMAGGSLVPGSHLWWKFQDGISLDQLGLCSLFWIHRDGQGEWSVFTGHTLITLTPVGERQSQIHQPEPCELAIESGRVSPRGEKKKQALLSEKWDWIQNKQEKLRYCTFISTSGMDVFVG